MGCGFSQRLATKEHHRCLHHPEHVVGAARSPPSGQERLPPRGSSCFPLFYHQPLSKGSAAALPSPLPRTMTCGGCGRLMGLWCCIRGGVRNSLVLACWGLALTNNWENGPEGSRTRDESMGSTVVGTALGGLLLPMGHGQTLPTPPAPAAF